MKLLVTIVAVLGVGAAVQAAPIIDIFLEPELDIGHWTESFIGGGPAKPGNIVEAASWDGSNLGDQWLLTGGELDEDKLVSTTVYGLLKVEQYLTTYKDGTLTLKAGGPWTGAGDGDYTVDLSGFTQSTIVTTYNNLVLNVTGAISMTGTIVGWAGYEMNYLAATSKIIGQGAPVPAEYLGLVAPATLGQWGEAKEIQMKIVPEPAALSLLALGGGLILVRRRKKK